MSWWPWAFAIRSRIAEAEGFTTYMVTPDKDFGQLVTERTLIYKPGTKGDPAEILGVAEVLDRWQIKRVDRKSVV